MVNFTISVNFLLVNSEETVTQTRLVKSSLGGRYWTGSVWPRDMQPRASFFGLYLADRTV